MKTVNTYLLSIMILFLPIFLHNMEPDIPQQNKVTYIKSSTGTYTFAIPDIIADQFEYITDIKKNLGSSSQENPITIELEETTLQQLIKVINNFTSGYTNFDTVLYNMEPSQLNAIVNAIDMLDLKNTVIKKKVETIYLQLLQEKYAKNDNINTPENPLHFLLINENGYSQFFEKLKNQIFKEGSCTAIIPMPVTNPTLWDLKSKLADEILIFYNNKNLIKYDLYSNKKKVISSGLKGILSLSWGSIPYLIDEEGLKYRIDNNSDTLIKEKSDQSEAKIRYFQREPFSNTDTKLKVMVIKYLATNNVILKNWAKTKFPTIQCAETDDITCFALNNSFDALATGSQRGMLHIWDITTSQGDLLIKKQFNQPIESLVYSNTIPEQIFIGFQDGTLECWNIEEKTIKQLFSFQAHRSSIKSMKIDIIHNTLVSADSFSIKKWDLEILLTQNRPKMSTKQLLALAKIIDDKKRGYKSVVTPEKKELLKDFEQIIQNHLFVYSPTIQKSYFQYIYSKFQTLGSTIKKTLQKGRRFIFRQ